MRPRAQNADTLPRRFPCTSRLDEDMLLANVRVRIMERPYKGGLVRLYLVVATGILASGCTVTSYSRPTGFVPLAYGSVDEFAALVPSSSGTPRCEEPTGAPGTRPGQ